MSPRTRVLIVDDSAFARKVLREVLSSCADVEVVGTARDGLEALEKISELTPDVITLDLVMPHLDGLGVLRGLPREGAPRVIVVSISDGDTELGAAALQAGAVDIVLKPTALATQQLYDLRDELVQKIRTAAAARSPRHLEPVRAELRLPEARRHEIIVIGTSTGGPQAITRLLMAMPANLPCPVAIALHIPPGYTEALAARLDAASAIEVREAAHGMELGPGQAVIAPGGVHLRLVRRGQRTFAELDHRQGDAQHAPSVDVLFASAAASFGSAALGVVLTGMGEDGLKGSSAIHHAGGIVLTESDLSCVVYGMPRAVKEAGYSHAEAPIEGMVQAILAHL